MYLTRLSPSFSLAPAAIAVVGLLSLPGCAPINFADFGVGTGAGAGGSASSGGYGGAIHDFTGGQTTAVAAGTGAGGASVVPTPVFYGYLCGGSDPGCSTDPTSSICAPGGNPGMGDDAPDSGTRTCQLVAADGQIEAACGMAGPGASGDICTSATSCQAGLGCASTGVQDLAVCEPFCCGDLEACPAATYCTQAPLVDTQLPIPVCTHVTPCELLNDAVWCKPTQTCAIVRNDGTTSCLDIGTGEAGGHCPCAAGYTCSYATDTCFQLCRIGSDDCGTGTCQGGTTPYPQGIGFCVPG